MASRIQNILKKLRNTSSDDPAYRVSEPFRTPASITVLPETGGIFCVNGRDTLELGKSIAKDCDWDVYYVAYKGAPAVKIDTTMWEILTPEPTVPCVVMADILASVDGKPYRTTRPVSCMNVEGGELDVPIKFVTDSALPGAFVDQFYKAYIGATMGSAFTGLEWSIADAPDWISLEPAASIDGIQRVAIVGIPEDEGEWTVKITASATGSSSEESPSKTLECHLVAMPLLPPRILTRDLGVWEAGRYREVELRSTVMDGSTDMTWDVSPRLPAGLTLDPETGVISGVPEPVDEVYTAEHTITLTVFDTAVSESYEVCVNPALMITTTTYLPDLVYDSSYEVRLEVTGALGPFSPKWLSFSPSTPQGLHLSEDGKLHTTPGEPAIELGEYQFRVGVIDGLGRAATKLLTLECVPETHFVTRNLVSGVMGREYRTTIHTTGTSGITLVSGSLPAGLDLVSTNTSSMGTISGIPLYSGTYEFTLGIGTGENQITRMYTIGIHEPPMIREGAAITTAMKNARYYHAVSATGSRALKYASVTPSLPAGLSLNPTTGSITGVPLESGTYSAGLSVTSPYGRDRANPEIRIRDGVAVTTKSPLPTAKSGMSYSAQMEADGMEEGDEWGAVWLPAGLTINAKTGLISGTPTAPETDVRDCIVTITVFTPEGALFIKNFVMGLNTKPTPAPSKIRPETLPPAYTGVEYSVTLSYHDEDSANVPVTWTSGQLPTGLTLNPDTGVISGTITEMPSEDECRFEITATYDGTILASREYTLTVIESTVITTNSLPDGKDGVKYGPVTLEHTGPIHDGFVWYLFPSSPSWLTIDPETGKISSGEHKAVYRADEYRVPVVIAKLDEYGNIEDALAYKVLPLRITKDPVIAPDSLPTAVRGVKYEGVKLTVDPPKPENYAWFVEGGGSDEWLEIDADTGELSGTPPDYYSTESVFNFAAIVRKREDTTVYAGKQFQLKVNPGHKIVPAILPKTAGIPDARVGVKYGVDFRLENCPADVETPYWWIYAGDVPEGLAIDPNTGTLAGVPTVAKTCGFTLWVSRVPPTIQVGNRIASEIYTVMVKPAPALTDSDPLPQVYPDGDYSHTFDTEGIDADAVWTVTGLPEGLRFDPADNSIKGSIPASWDSDIHRHFVTVHVQNPDKTEVERVFSLYTGPAVRMAIDTLPIANGMDQYPETLLQAIGPDGAIEEGWTISCDNLPGTGSLKIENNVLKGKLGNITKAGPEEAELVMTMKKGSKTALQTIPLSYMNTALMEWGAIATAPSLPPIRIGRERTYKIELTPISQIQNAEWLVGNTETGYASEFTKTVMRVDADGIEKTVTVFTAEIKKTGTLTADLTIAANDTDTIRVDVKCTFGRSDKGSETKSSVVEFHAGVILPSSAPTILTESLPPVYEGLEYNTELKYDCTDMETPVEWSVSADTPLPAGLTLDSATGVLSGWIGREVTGKTYPVTVTVSHKFGMDTKPFEIVAGSETEGPVRLRERSLPQPVADWRYSAMLTVLGDRSVRMTMIGYGFPSGMGLTGTVPVVTITGDAVDDHGRTTFTLLVIVRGEDGQPVFSREYDLSWAPPAPEPVELEFVDSLPEGTEGVPYSQPLITKGLADDMDVVSGAITQAGLIMTRKPEYPGQCWVSSDSPKAYDGPLDFVVKRGDETIKEHLITRFVIKENTLEFVDSLPEGTARAPYAAAVITKGYADDMTAESVEFRQFMNMELIRNETKPGQCWVSSNFPNAYDGPVGIEVKRGNVVIAQYEIPRVVIHERT